MTSPRQERRKAKKRNRSGSEPFLDFREVGSPMIETVCVLVYADGTQKTVRVQPWRRLWDYV